MTPTQRATSPGRGEKMNVRTLMQELANKDPNAEVVVFLHSNGDNLDVDAVAIRADIEDDYEDRPRCPGKPHPSDILLGAGPEIRE